MKHAKVLRLGRNDTRAKQCHYCHVGLEKRAKVRNFAGNDKNDPPNDRHDSARASWLFLQRGVWRFFQFLRYTFVDSTPVYNYHLRNTVATRCRNNNYESRYIKATLINPIFCKFFVFTKFTRCWCFDIKIKDYTSGIDQFSFCEISPSVSRDYFYEN